MDTPHIDLDHTIALLGLDFNWIVKAMYPRTLKY
jgi:hypothetical protein